MHALIFYNLNPTGTIEHRSLALGCQELASTCSIKTTIEPYGKPNESFICF